MFEQVVLRRSPTGTALTAGELTEALLFYDNVHILLEHGSLTGLLNTIGPDPLHSLIRDNRLKASYYRDMVGTRTETKNYVQTHQFCTFEFVGNKDTGPQKNIEDNVRIIFERSLGKSSKTKKSVKQFLDNVSIEKLGKGFNHSNGIPGLASDDLNEPHYVRDAVEIAIRTALPKFYFPDFWEFKILKIDGEFMINTNLNMDELNAYHKKFYPGVDRNFTPVF